MNERIGYVLCGGSAAFSDAPAGNRIASYVALAQDLGPRLKRHGIKRVEFHNPGGLFPLVEVGGNHPDMSMRVDQWIIAERCRLIYADRYDFRTAIGILEEHGVTEVILYVGSASQLLDPVRELPQVLEAFTACGPIISFCFDAIFQDADWREQWAAGSKYREALAAIRKRHKVYAEPRLSAEHVKAGLGKLIDGTIAEAWYDRAPHFNVDLSIQPGETLRITDAQTEAAWKADPWWPEIKAWPANVEPVLRSDQNWGPGMDAVPMPADWIGAK